MREARIVELGQLASFINGDRGSNYPSEGDFVDEGFPFVNAGHLTEGRVDFSKMNYISESRFNLLGSGKIQAGDIVYCLRGSLGKLAIYRDNRPAAIASSLVIIRPHSESDTEYLYHFLNSPLGKQEIRKFDNGSSQPNLSAASVKSYRVPFPSLEEQRRIAAILDQAETLLAKRRQALAKLDTLTQSLFLDTFIRSNKSEQKRNLNDVCHLIVDGTHKTPAYTETGIPFVTVKNITSGELDLSKTKFITHEEHKLLTRRTRPERSNILVSKDGTIGIPCLIDTDESFSIFVSVALLKLKTDLVDPVFLCAQLASEEIQKQIRDSTKGIAIRHLHLTDFKRLKVIVPPMQRQLKFRQSVVKINRDRAAQKRSATMLDGLNLSLQHRAFRGEL